MKEQIILPSDFLPEGRVKIELFDDLTGKKIEEYETKNFIANGIREQFFKLVQADIFTRYKYTGQSRLHEALVDPFRIMSLTDASHPEQPNEEWLRRGKLIGYAYTNETYSGSDPQRGSYNAKESFTNLEQVHIVIDFPTHAANGTFQSVYFHSDSDLISTAKVLIAIPKDIRIIKKHGNKYYAQVGSASSNLEIYDLNFNLLEEVNVGRSFYDFVIVGDYIYFSPYSSPYGIYRAPISDPANWEQINSTRIYGITHDSKNNLFFVKTYYSPGLLEMRDSNFNLLGAYENVSLQFPLFFDENANAILGNKYGDPPSSTVFLLNEKIEFTLMWRNYTRGIIGYDENSFFVNAAEGYSSPYYVYRHPKVHFGSRALLDSPVTKTANHTMKVTYDFMLP